MQVTTYWLWCWSSCLLWSPILHTIRLCLNWWAIDWWWHIGSYHVTIKLIVLINNDRYLVLHSYLFKCSTFSLCDMLLDVKQYIHFFVRSRCYIPCSLQSLVNSRYRPIHFFVHNLLIVDADLLGFYYLQYKSPTLSFHALIMLIDDQLTNDYHIVSYFTNHYHIVYILADMLYFIHKHLLNSMLSFSL